MCKRFATSARLLQSRRSRPTRRAGHRERATSPAQRQGAEPLWHPPRSPTRTRKVEAALYLRYDGRVSDVFISYAREDSASASSFAATLKEQGLSVFWDRTIAIGAAFEKIIEVELGCARVVVVLWSRHSVASDWVRAEAADAVDRGVLVPAALDGTALPLRYRSVQTADLSTWSSGQTGDEFNRLINDIVAKARGEASRLSSARRLPAAHLRFLIAISLVWAWVGSLALATTVAFDYGLVRGFLALHAAVYIIVYLSLIGGAVSTGLVGGMSLKRRFVRGVLQGWVWPVAAAFGQLLLLMGVSRLLSSLPSASELDAWLAFILCGSIGPSLLTLMAVGTLHHPATPQMIRRSVRNDAS
jgi:hypothetical protein